MRYFVHDFLFEETSTNKIKGCFFYHVSVYCTHKRECVDEEFEKFFVSVANPDGVAHHLKILQNVFKKSQENSFFNGPFMILDDYEETEVMKLLKQKIENATGITKRELVYNLSPFVEWEYLSDDNVVRQFFS